MNSLAPHTLLSPPECRDMCVCPEKRGGPPRARAYIRQDGRIAAQEQGRTSRSESLPLLANYRHSEAAASALPLLALAGESLARREGTARGRPVLHQDGALDGLDGVRRLVGGRVEKC